MIKKSSVNYNELEDKLTAKKSYKLSDVQHKIKKVAFDVVKFDSASNIDGLWQIEKGVDGDYIVAMYDEETAPAIKTASKIETNWSVLSDKTGANLSLFYKGTPVTRLVTATLGIPTNDSELVQSYLPSKLATNSKLVEGLLQEISVSERKELFSKHPELEVK